MCILYYGIVLAVDSIPGKFFFKFAIMQIVELPSYIVYLLLIDVVGRRPLYVAGLLLGDFIVFVSKMLFKQPKATNLLFCLEVSFCSW